MTMLDRKISKKGAYVKLKPEVIKRTGEKISIISDTMFLTMINNESRKQYASYLIALVLDCDYKKVYDTIIFVKNVMDKDLEISSKKTVDFVCELDGEVIGIEMNNNTTKDALLRNISYAGD